MKIFKYTIGILLLAFAFSCNKSLKEIPVTSTPVEDMTDLNINSSFQWQSGLIGEFTVTFSNPNNVSTELEIINIIDSKGEIVKRNRIMDGKVKFNVELPQNSKYFLQFPVTGNVLEITSVKDIVMELGPTASFKSAAEISDDVPNCTSCENPIINAGAEQPIINSGYTIIHQNQVPGWETTASDHMIEIWTSGFNGVPAQEGNQFFELNANRVADLYQELCLEPGSTIIWSVWHRGRSGVDVAKVKIGATVSSAVEMATMTDGTSAWGHYTGSYTVPENQTTTFFVFSSVSSTGGGSYGNFLDNFEIACDYDGDGVPDDEDDEPGDPEIAYKSYFPTSGKQIVAFEDLWPSLGDFDFNDLTMSNQVVMSQNSNFEILSADFKVSIDAIGAGIHNGIGMMLYDGNGQEIPNNIIASISGDVSLDPENTNGLILTNNVYSFIENYYQNNGVGPTSIPDTLRFTVIFAGTLLDFTPELYIFRNNDRSHEVHRSNFPATAAANLGFFNQFDDNGNYETANGLPWGIEIILEGNYSSPREKIQILAAYPEFQQWALSGGTLNTDWYMNPVPAKVFDIFE